MFWFAFNIIIRHFMRCQHIWIDELVYLDLIFLEYHLWPLFTAFKNKNSFLKGLELIIPFFYFFFKFFPSNFSLKIFLFKFFSSNFSLKIFLVKFFSLKRMILYLNFQQISTLFDISTNNLRWKKMRVHIKVAPTIVYHQSWMLIGSRQFILVWFSFKAFGQSVTR